MPFFVFSCVLLFAAYPLIGSAMAVWLLAGSQLVLLVREIRKRQVSGVGGFIFLSFLFFGVRPIYLILESDYQLMVMLFRVRADLESVGVAMWWASAGLCCFAFGAFVAPKISRNWLQRRRLKAKIEGAQASVTAKVCYAMMFFQLMTLPVMHFLAKSGRGLYASGAGAYAYDLPVPLQSVHIIAVVVLLERYLRTKTPVSLAMLGISGLLFLNFTWLMRDVSLFRGFYIAGVMIVGIAALQRIKGRVGLAWLIIPIVLVQPFFAYLGDDRHKKNEELAEEGIVDEVFGQQTLAETYWQFYDSRGDMNIFDTFVAATKAEPAFRPYLWSWIYVPLHLIPRAWWPSKPKRGTTMDLGFTRGAPYSPGIAGLFLADGGLVWMLLSMGVLGLLVSLLDCWVLTLPRGYLQYCLIGIVAVNAMFLTRFFLWQYFYQTLYSFIPCLLLAKYLTRGSRASRRPKAALAPSGPRGISA